MINEIKNRPLKKEVSLLCTSNIQEITVEKALKKADVIFLDVREMGEEPTLEMDNYQQIPLSKISENLYEINTDSEIIVLCQGGERSKNAIQILIQNNFNNCHNLKGGAPALLAQLKHNAV